jgi:hypothetical protein
MSRSDFSTVTGQQMTRSIQWARLARNAVQDNYRAELGQITLQRAASRAADLGVNRRALGARSAASTFPAGPLPSNDRKEVRTLERL